MPAPLLDGSFRIDAGAAGPLLAWCPQTNLLAVQGAAASPDAQQICLVDPAEPQAYTAASVPLDAASGERLLALDWAPCGTEAQLLAATSAGAVHVLAQQPAGRVAEQPTSLDAWHCSRVFDTPVPPLRVRWLCGPPAWQWTDAEPQQPGAAGGAELRFQPCPRLSSAWLRPSLACFIAIAPDGSFQVVWRELGQCWLAGQAAPPGWPPALAGADAAVGSDGALWLLGWQAQAGSLELCCFRGDPTARCAGGGAGLWPAGSQQLRLEAGRTVLAAALDPGAGGLVVAAAGADGVCLQSFAMHAGESGPSFSRRAQRTIRAAAADAPPAAVCQTEAGCLACAGGGGLALLSPGALQVGAEVPMSAPATAAALSGNGEALALVAADGSVQLLLADAAAAPAHLARRLAWSVLRGSSAWDVLAALRAAQPPALQAALAAADAAAHAQPAAVRGALCAALSRAKLQLLPELPDAAAAAVAQDCWARCLLGASEPVLAAVHAAVEEHKQRQQRPGGGGGGGGPSLGAADRMAVSGWASWADSYAALLLQAARLWAARRAAVEGRGGEAAAAADALPCVRLLADSSFMARLRQALMLQVLLKRSGANREAGLKEAGLARALAGALDALQAAAAPPGAAAAAGGEAGGGCQAAARAAQQSFQGAYALHYCQPVGRVDWRGVAAAMEQPPLSALAKLLPAPEEGSLGRLALRLGLLHARQPPPPDAGPPPGLQPLALAPDAEWLWGGGEGGGARGAKRRRWQRERDAALGLDGRPVAGRAPLDCVTGHSLGWSREVAFTTAGGLSATADLTGDLYPRDAGRPELQDSRRAWYHACPVTGLPWKRAAQF